MRILVTGASGLLGTAVTEILVSNGHEVHAVARVAPGNCYGAEWHEVDLLASKPERVMRDVSPEVLVHLAWFTTPPAFWTSPLNVDWAVASLQLIRAFSSSGGRRVVMAGSCAEYGSGRIEPYREDDIPAPQTIYGVAKNAVRALLEQYAGLSGLEYAWGRIFFMYGPGEPANKLVSGMIHALQNGEIPQMTDPDRRLDFIAVNDVAQAFAQLVEHRFSGLVNIGSGTDLSVRQAAELIASRVAPSLLPSIGAVPTKKSHNHMLADVAILRRLLFVPKPFAVGIRRMTRA